MGNPLKNIVNPDSVLFLGASNSIETMGTGQLLSMLVSEYEGEIYPVHPEKDKVLNMKAYKRVEEVPCTPDLAVLTLPTELVPDILEKCGKKGVKRAIITSGGFEEIGNEKSAKDLERVAKKYGIRYLGPNCIGATNTYKGMNTTWIPSLPKKRGCKHNIPERYIRFTNIPIHEKNGNRPQQNHKHGKH